MEDAFVSFVSSCLLDPERDVQNKMQEEEEEEEHHIVEESICEILPYSHDVLVPLRDRAFSWDVSLENDKVHPDLLLASVVDHSKIVYKPKVFSHVKNESEVTMKGDSSLDNRDGELREAGNVLLDDEEDELFGEDLLPPPVVVAGGLEMPPPPPHANMVGNVSTRPPRPRIRVTLKPEIPRPPSNGKTSVKVSPPLKKEGVASSVNIIARSGSKTKTGDSSSDAAMRASGGLYHYPDASYQSPAVSSLRTETVIIAAAHRSSNNSNMASVSSGGNSNILGHSSASLLSPTAYSALSPVSVLNSSTTILPGGDRRVGAYSLDERRMKIEKFRERKRQRIWRKQIKYDCRKRLADTRPRVKGRFVSRKKVGGGDGGTDDNGGEGGNNSDEEETDSTSYLHNNNLPKGRAQDYPAMLVAKPLPLTTSTVGYIIPNNPAMVQGYGNMDTYSMPPSSAVAGQAVNNYPSSLLAPSIPPSNHTNNNSNTSYNSIYNPNVVHRPSSTAQHSTVVVSNPPPGHAMTNSYHTASSHNPNPFP